MLTGERPFAGETLIATFGAILTQPVPDLSRIRSDVPDALADLVYRMLEKDRHQRIPSVRLVGAELEGMLAVVSGQLSAIAHDESLRHAYAARRGAQTQPPCPANPLCGARGGTE